jgi:hypothetical protein
MSNPIFQYNDGGRAAAGFTGEASDCVARAIAIALKQRYATVYRELALANKAAGRKKSARNGIHRDVYELYLKQHGWAWHPAPRFIGRKARTTDLPPWSRHRPNG